MTPGRELAAIAAALDLAIFEQIATGLFQPLSRLPSWAGCAENDPPWDLTEHFPILEMFLADCENVWNSPGSDEGPPPLLESDIWTEPNAQGGESYLQAVAVGVNGRRLLVVRSLPQALFTYQQLAHDFELAKDHVERLSRELDLKRREAERATQAKSDFLAAMSHEIRTPLNAIIGMADVLMSTPLSAEQRKSVEVFQRNGVALLNLINEILDLSKVEAGRVELETVEMDLRDVIARAMEVVEIRAKAKGLYLRQEIDPGVPVWLKGDPHRLRQVIINLLGNSIKFTEQGGLRVRVRQDPLDTAPGRLLFAISDSGIGIPEDKLGTIFESFGQADSSTTRKYGGTGLGLTISKQLIELMSGRIWVESQVGTGSTFFFTAKFDVQADQSERAAAPAEAAQKSVEDLEALASGLRILLADDSEDNRFLILSYLKNANCSVDVAEDGQIALQKFRSGPCDLVLMDVEMPVMDGYTATREIRRFESETRAAPTPVLALTAHAFADMAVKGYDAGFTGLLTKPIRKITLLEALERYRPDRRATPVPVAPAPNAGKLAEQAESDGPLRVRVEQGMEDVVPGYLEKRRAEVALYRQALNARDFDSIRKLAHKMKGTGSGYGFPLLTQLGGELERAAIDADEEELDLKIEKLARYVERVELEYM